MSDEMMINIEVDGRQLKAAPGQMLIEVTDAAGIPIPRFCYHKKLSVAANCRMCLVELKGSGKPIPACATPVNEGMQVLTRSALAREAQKSTMEFLLINHPLDCPICDQGGECELQDVAMGYGRDVSRFHERKRVVRDEDIGPLIKTDMTRCIHCTRCVRFGAEVAGLRELGATGRGEHMKIGVFVENSLHSELSGNVIDLCPVGALTSRPFLYQARAWELEQRDGVSPHDGLGANLSLHVRGNRVMRIVPRENESINETWLSDRDRFSYPALYVGDRLERPMVRERGELREVDWQEALEKAAGILHSAGDGIGTLVSPNAALEEMYLAQKLTRALGSAHIDHRLRQTDFRGDACDPGLPWAGQRFESYGDNDAVLLIGSWLRKELPLLNARLRVAAREGAQIMSINPVAYDYNFDLAVDIVEAPSLLVRELTAVARAAGVEDTDAGVEVDAAHEAIARALADAGQGLVVLGEVAHAHPDFSRLRQLADRIAAATGVDIGYLPPGGNTAAAWMAGCVPHRGPGGAEVAAGGQDAGGICRTALSAYLLLQVEPEYDLANPAQAMNTLTQSRVICLQTYLSDWARTHAEVVLPIAAPFETTGTYVNLQGDRQRAAGAVAPPGEARPAWKVLRVLANLSKLEGFEQLDIDAVAAEVDTAVGVLAPDNRLAGSVDGDKALTPVAGSLERIGGTPIYASDPLVRRSTPLQRTPDAWSASARVHPADAARLSIDDGQPGLVSQGDANVVMRIVTDERVPEGCIWLPTGIEGSESLGAGFGNVRLERA